MTITYAITKIEKMGDREIEVKQYEYAGSVRNYGVVNMHKAEKSDEELRWSREVHATRSTREFYKLLVCNIQEDKNTLFESRTYEENMTSPEIAKRDSKVYTEKVKKMVGKELNYIEVLETQKRGAQHAHRLWFNMPVHINEISERKNRTLAKLWGHGFVDVKDKKTSVNEMCRYLTKYMNKAKKDKRYYKKKAYTTSRNIQRPEKLNFLSEINLYIDNNTKVQTREYKTRWLGQARQQIYYLTP